MFQISFSDKGVGKIPLIEASYLKRKAPSRNKTGTGVKLFETCLKRKNAVLPIAIIFVKRPLNKEF